MDPRKTQITVGPPGCGKSHYLLSQVEKALAEGTKPNEIAFLSFTRKAADEGRERACKQFNLTEGDFPYFRTLHSLAFSRLGVRREQMLGREHLDELGNLLGLEFKGRAVVDDEGIYGMNEADRMLFLEGLSRNTLTPLKQVWASVMEDEIDWFELERFAKALEEYKRSRHLYDFSDLIRIFCERGEAPKLKLLVIDEGQDLSASQWITVDKLAESADRVLIAGDDCQSIYSWSGADVNMFINLEGEQKTLEQSYRVPAAVHRLADEIAGRIVNKRQRAWKPRTEEGRVEWYGDVEEIDASKGTWLMLARCGYMVNELEDWCMSQGFSFTSVNRNPLKSKSFDAIRRWENLRKGKDEAPGAVVDVLKFVFPSLAPPTLTNWLKSLAPDAMVGMPELTTNGLKTTDIWHRALGKLPVKDRDFFIAAAQRREPMLKEPRIRISTIHAAKGGEAEHVLLTTDMSYRIWSKMQDEPDDELRCWFVGATRCKESLHIVMPRTNMAFEF